MQSFLAVCLFCVLLGGAVIESSPAGCFEDWSRCSPSTSALTGKLWLPCNTYCKVCFKADSGKCVKSPSKNCPNLLKNNMQCVCKNKRTAKNKANPACWA